MTLTPASAPACAAPAQAPTPSTEPDAVRRALRDRLVAFPDWVLADPLHIAEMTPRLWPGWERMHAVSFFGSDTAVLLRDGSLWALWTYNPDWLIINETEEVRFVIATAAQRRAGLNLLADQTLMAPSLPDLYAAVISGYVDEPSDPFLTVEGSSEVEAMVTVLAEMAERLRDGGRHHLTAAHPWGELILNRVAQTQADIAQAVSLDEEKERVWAEERAGWGNPDAPEPGEINMSRYAANTTFAPGGCPLHEYPTA